MITWTKTFFSETFIIFKENKQIGFLKNDLLSTVAFSSLQQNNYEFRTTGFLNQITQIYDSQSKMLIGNIRYDWSGAARIELLNGEIYFFKRKGFSVNKWVITNKAGTVLHYYKNVGGGEIKYKDENELLLLTGLFVGDYYQKSSLAVFIVLFVPFFILLMN